MVKPVKLKTKKPSPKPKKASKPESVAYIRVRVANGCKACGGEVEYCWHPGIGELLTPKTQGYFECVFCRLYIKNIPLAKFHQIANLVKGGK